MAYRSLNNTRNQHDKGSWGKREDWRHWPALAAFLIAVLFLSAWVWQKGWLGLFGDLDRLRAIILSLGLWAPLVIIALNVAQVIFAPIPGHALNMASGFLFGPWLGTLYTLIGVLCGSLIVLGLVRRLGRPLARRLAGQRNLERFDRYAERHGTLFLFLVFLLPFMPDDLACLAAGLTPLPIYQIILLQLVGRAPGLFVANWIGHKATALLPWQWGIFGIVILALAFLFWRFQASIEGHLSQLTQRLSRRR